jgi:molybdate transport system substrate-binding protein
MLFVGCNGTEKSDENAKTSDNQETKEILVAAAASLKNPMEELQKLYKEKYPNVEITFTFGSSGSLEQQIEQGAPVDVFVSAASKQMDALVDKKLILEQTRTDILENKIVLIVPKDSKLGITSFEDITKANKIALGDPDSVPAGEYAKEVLTHLQLFEKIEDRTTYAKDVTEVLTWVSMENADAGIVYTTDAISSKDVLVVAEAPEGSYSKVIYPAAVVKETKEETAAREFLSFLSLKEAQKVFEKYGFKPVIE